LIHRWEGRLVAEILGLGLSHYPPLCLPDADMAEILRWTLQDPSIPAKEKDVAHWPAPMRAEWADDFGARAAGKSLARGARCLLELVARVSVRPDLAPAARHPG
jgi:hypothetical protein